MSFKEVVQPIKKKSKTTREIKFRVSVKAYVRLHELAKKRKLTVNQWSKAKTLAGIKSPNNSTRKCAICDRTLNKTNVTNICIRCQKKSTKRRNKAIAESN